MTIKEMEEISESMQQKCGNCKWFDDDGDRTACFCPDRYLKFVYKDNWCPKWEEI